MIASASLDIPAPASAVWDVLADIEGWPRFIPGVSRTRRLDIGEIAPGTRFSWVNGGFPIRSRVEIASRPDELTWTGVALWLVAVHRNTVESLPDGGCRFACSESMAGVGASWAMPSSTLQPQLEAWVRTIGEEAQRRA